MPASCNQGDSGDYAVKHNPAAYFTNIQKACDARDVSLTDPIDLSARFTFVTPNLCHDMHDCPVSTGDRWLAGFLPHMLESGRYRAGHTAVFLTYDEDDGSAGNHVATFVIAPGSRGELGPPPASRTIRCCGPAKRCWVSGRWGQPPTRRRCGVPLGYEPVRDPRSLSSLRRCSRANRIRLFAVPSGMPNSTATSR
jgi:Phosphoesterase family